MSERSQNHRKHRYHDFLGNIIHKLSPSHLGNAVVQHSSGTRLQTHTTGHTPDGTSRRCFRSGAPHRPDDQAKSSCSAFRNVFHAPNTITIDTPINAPPSAALSHVGREYNTRPNPPIKEEHPTMTSMLVAIYHTILD